MKPITDRQLQYLNVLLNRALGETNRKLYLKIFYKVDSSKNLDMYEASEIIEKFVPDNRDIEKNKGIALEKIYDFLGQKRLL